jgi:hypothetical protein
MTSHWFFRQGRNVEREAVSLGGLLDINQNLHDFACWHLSDMRGQADDVCSSGQSRPRGYKRRIPKLTPKRTFRRL